MKTWISILLFFFTLLFPYSSLAGAPYASGSVPVTSNNKSRAMIDPEYEKCGQDCIYSKANENISLQADFIIKKIMYIQIEPDSDKKKKILGNFCSSTEDGDDCANRYVAMHRFWFMKVRSSLGKNEKNRANLGCTRFDVQGNCLVDTQAKAVEMGQSLPGSNQINTPPKYTQVAHFSTFQDLQKQAQIDAFQKHGQAMNSLMQVSSSASDDAWVNETYNDYKPNRDDFIKFKEIFKDPNHPELGTQQIPMTNAMGNPLYDEAAYQRALNAWGNNPNDPTHESLLTDLNQMKGKISEKKIQNENEFISEQAPPSQGPKSVDHFIYDQVRGKSVDQINQDSANRSTASKNNPDIFGNNRDRKNQNQPQNQSNTGKIYNGNEQIHPPLAKPDAEGNTTGVVTYSYSPEFFSQTDPSQSTSSAQTSAGATPASHNNSMVNQGKNSVPGAGVTAPSSGSDTQSQIDQLFF